MALTPTRDATEAHSCSNCLPVGPACPASEVTPSQRDVAGFRELETEALRKSAADQDGDRAVRQHVVGLAAEQQPGQPAAAM